MRLFIAIELPDDIKRLLNRLRCLVTGARWVPVEQVHLTLAFLGEVEDGTLKLLTNELATIHVPCFDIRFGGTGCFPNRGQPHVLWVGLEPEPLLSSLATQVRTSVVACGIPLEERPFSPHITLARLKSPVAGEVAPFLDHPPLQEFPPVTVCEFILFQSRLTSHGAIHSPIKGYALQRSTGR